MIVPRVAVIESNDVRDFEEAIRQAEHWGTLLCSSNEPFGFVLCKLFPRCGGSLKFCNSEYVYRADQMPNRPRVRLLAVVPSDFPHFNRFFICLRRIGLVALLAQTVIGTAVSKYKHRAGNQEETVTFELDSEWQPKTTEVPNEKRTFDGSNKVSLSGPIADESEESLPPVGLLKVDKTIAELYGDRRLAAYIMDRLDLLNIRSSTRIAYLTFIVPPIESLSEYGLESFVTKRNVCVIKSRAFHLLPASFLELYSVLRSTEEFHDSNCRSLLRIALREPNTNKVSLRHSVGGAVASLLGAVVHELGHLFKLPHTRWGIMKSGGDNVQTLFFPDKYLNLAVSRWSEYNEKYDTLVTANTWIATDEVIAETVAGSMFDEIALKLLTHSYFISWTVNKNVEPILYDEATRTVRTKSKIVAVLFYSDSERDKNSLISYTEINPVETLRLEKLPNSFALVLALDGNSIALKAS